MSYIILLTAMHLHGIAYRAGCFRGNSGFSQYAVDKTGLCVSTGCRQLPEWAIRTHSAGGARGEGERSSVLARLLPDGAAH